MVTCASFEQDNNDVVINYDDMWRTVLSKKGGNAHVELQRRYGRVFQTVASRDVKYTDNELVFKLQLQDAIVELRQKYKEVI